MRADFGNQEYRGRSRQLQRSLGIFRVGVEPEKMTFTDKPETYLWNRKDIISNLICILQHRAAEQ